MPRIAPAPHVLTKSQARRIWLRAQRLDTVAPFGDGPEATRAAVEHLGYVQIDTINVIERSPPSHPLHPHPGLPARASAPGADASTRRVFEYWTHALSYVPTRRPALLHAARCSAHRAGAAAMVRQRCSQADLRKVLTRIRRDGALTIRDIDDDVLVEKDHPWASRKPSKRALQLAFYRGAVTISERTRHAQDL